MSLHIRLLRATVAAAVIIAVVVGGFWALLTFGRLDVFSQIDWSNLLTTRDDGSLVLGIISAIGWVAWALATLSVVSEFLVALAGRRWRLRIPGVGLFAPASAVLVAAIVGLLGSQLITPSAAAGAPTIDDASMPLVPAAAPLVTRTQQAPAPTDRTQTTHLVQPGDDLWSLAQRYYQDGAKWRVIAEANSTVLLRGTDHLEPGMLLIIPGATAGAEVGGAVTVQPGDSLSSLAADHLGDADRWPEIVAANTDLVSDPDVIEPGWRLRLPATDEPVPSGSAERAEAGSDAPDHPVDGGSGSRDERSQAEPITPDERVRTEPQTPGEQSAGEGTPQDDQFSQPGEQPTAPEDQTTIPDPAPDPGLPVPPTTCPAERSSATQTASVQAETTNHALLLGLGLAAGVATAFGLRRRQQAAQRPLGRQMPSLPQAAMALSVDLANARDTLTSDPALPTGTGSLLAPDGRPVIIIGDSAGHPVSCDLEANAITWLAGRDGDDVALANAIALALTCDTSDAAAFPDRGQPKVVVAGAELVWLAGLDQPHLTALSSVAEGEDFLARAVEARSNCLPEGEDLTALRSDPGSAEAWAPLVVVLSDPPAGSLPRTLGLLGVSVVVCQGAKAALSTGVTIEVDGDKARNLTTGQVFTPVLATAPARRALAEMFTVANQADYPFAPWWDETPQNEAPTALQAAWAGPVEELPVAATIDSDHPVVHLLGTVELTGTRGTPPVRATKQCVEYCAWILENPGSSSIAMARSLGVAEPTRRSNMSHLRSWLGNAADGSPYLPEAYTGRIELHPGVTSDWERLQVFVSGGVNRVGDAGLVQALGLVRGAPLADSAPGQWNWAEQLRADMSATIRDIGVVLARRALARGDHDLARWAITRAEVAAPDDQLLTGCRILLAHHSGDRPEVDRLVMQVTRRARNLGVDLSDELVVLLQQVVEGRARARA